MGKLLSFSFGVIIYKLLKNNYIFKPGACFDPISQHCFRKIFFFKHADACFVVEGNMAI